jgi:hypothetical protein
MIANRRKSAILILGLRTSDSRRARFLGGQITALADLFFRDAMHLRLSFDALQTVFRNVFTEHLDKLDAVVACERMDPDLDLVASRRSDIVMGWVFRLLETRCVGNRRRYRLDADAGCRIGRRRNN